MDTYDEAHRDLAALVVPLVGSLEATQDCFEPYRLVGPDGGTVACVRDYFNHLQAAGRAAATQRSYGMDLLRWFRFLWATGIPWQQATRIEARDFIRWMQITPRPSRVHWRSLSPDAVGSAGAGEAGYAPSTRAHSETVLRHFYAFHLEAGTGPLVNPFPLDRGRTAGRRYAHHDPMDPYEPQRSGLYRPRVVQQVPRRIPDGRFNELFGALSCHRDRALVALWISTGARAGELLGANRGDADPGRQLISVVRKGSRAVQQLPGSPDAFVWLRLYQAQMDPLVSTGGDDPLWWTLRRPFRRLSYHGAYRMFTQGGYKVGWRGC